MHTKHNCHMNKQKVEMFGSKKLVDPWDRVMILLSWLKNSDFLTAPNIHYTKAF